MKYCVWLAFGLMLLVGPVAGAQEEESEKAAEKVAAADETPFQILQKEFEAVETSFGEQRNGLFKEYQAAKDDDAREAIIEKLKPLEEETNAKKDEIGNKVKEMIESSTSEDESFEMTSWILKNVQSEEMQAYAVDQIVTRHVKSEKILDLIPALGQSMPSESSRMALEKIAADGANDEIKGNAAISLAVMLSEGRDMAKEYLGMGEEVLEGMPEPMLKFMKSSAELTDEQIEEMFKSASEKFGEVKFRKSTIAVFVEQRLKAIEMQKNLQVGKIAPDIAGPDIDGVDFKLSDYRGKVVMLDFWGDW